MPRLSKIGAAALAAFGWTGISSVSASYLVVAGGAGGGFFGGGGGAGGLLTGTATLNPTLSYTITVGAGGAGAASNAARGSNGSDSVFNAVTSTGGGGGGSDGFSPYTGASGGSGGGGSYKSSSAGGAGTSGQGFAGGSGIEAGPNYTSGGGGGAGAVGGNGSASGAGGSGGVGLTSSITGTSTYYAGGGGGDSQINGSVAPGGLGGGGAGARSGVRPVAGTANLGGGGGGGGSSTFAGAQGGSGIVIISYAGAQQFSGGVVTSSGGNTIHTFTTSGTLGPITPLSANYLVVAGGGGGGNVGSSDGGGGAGGLLSGSSLTIDPYSTYVVTVGGGGSAAASGSNSAFSMVSTAAVGGGYGANTSGIGGNGGSGGGGAGGTSPGNAGGTATSGQGFAGGRGLTDGVYTAGGGGGGNSAVGANATTGGAPSLGKGGAGGAGTASSISGSSVTYAGGGGGGSNAGSSGDGGTGGGGNGQGTAPGTVRAGVAGTANLGGGGGSGNAGGSGVVIISYAGATQLMAGGVVTIAGGNVIHTFNSSGFLSPLTLFTRSLRFRGAYPTTPSYLSRTAGTPTNNLKWTFSFWAKRGVLSVGQHLLNGGTGTSASEDYLQFLGSDKLAFYQGNATTTIIATNAVFRDPAAWYHIVLVYDSAQATSTNRLFIYVNGVSQSFSSATYPTLNQSTNINASGVLQRISSRTYLADEGFDGYMAEVNFIDGQALAPTAFGTVNSYGVWQPITYGGSYGNNGFRLPFTNNASTTTLGYDFSPQGNNWTATNISVTAGATYDSMTDVPTLTSATAANYCVLNPLSSSSSMTITGGNLNITSGVGPQSFNAYSSMAALTGKFYAEVLVNTGGVADMIGVCPSTLNAASARFDGVTGGVGYASDGKKYVPGGSSAYGATYTSGDTIGIALDMDAQTVTFYKNNTSQGVISSAFTANVAYYFATADADGSVGINQSFNFGQRPFTYTPPSGFVALNTYNL